MGENIVKINIPIIEFRIYIQNFQILRIKNKKTKGLNEHFNNRAIRMINKHMKLCSTSFIIGEMKDINYNEIALNIDQNGKIKATDHTNYWQGYETI